MNRRSFGLAALCLALSTPAFAQGPVLQIHKDPSCGCCTAWADLARAAGYSVTLIDSADIGAVKDKAGVPAALWSCHTVLVEGYVVEGHVPFDALARLLETRPDVTGIAVPGMPEGSPGMGDDPAARYDVVAWGGDAGEGAVFHRAGAL
jgi:hypothetical protein